jgi:hypothetical protein
MTSISVVKEENCFRGIEIDVRIIERTQTDSCGSGSAPIIRVSKQVNEPRNSMKYEEVYVQLNTRIFESSVILRHTNL